MALAICARERPAKETTKPGTLAFTSSIETAAVRRFRSTACVRVSVAIVGFFAMKGARRSEEKKKQCAT